MPQREVIRFNPKRRGGVDVLGITCDYELLEVGDWFEVRSQGMRSMVNKSIGRSHLAQSMKLEWTEVSPRVWHVARTE